MKMWRDFRDDKFLQDINESSLTKPHQRVLNDQLVNVAIFFGIIKIRDRAGCEASDDSRVVWLPSLVVALANHDVPHCVQKPGSATPGALVVVARILMQKRWQYRAANERPCNDISVGGAETLRITIPTLPVAGEVICRLLKTSNDGYSCKGEWFNG